MRKTQARSTWQAGNREALFGKLAKKFIKDVLKKALEQQQENDDGTERKSIAGQVFGNVKEN